MTKADQVSILGDVDGVTVEKAENGFNVGFDFDRTLGKMLRVVPGAELNPSSGFYVVPESSANELSKAVMTMRFEQKAIVADRVAIFELANASAVKAQREAGAATQVLPQVSDFRQAGQFYGGEILNINAHFAAQLTGFGKDDGAAFVTIHRLADLDTNKIFKGDRIGIIYDHKYLGVVSDLSKGKSAVDLDTDFKANLGKKIDGVSLTDGGGTVGVEFDLNPVLLARIKRVDGVVFNKDEGRWDIPVGNKEFALRAAYDMRKEFVLDSAEVETMKLAAGTKIDNPKVTHAFSKDGHEYFGPAIGVGDRYLLQKTGSDKFVLHHLASLDQKPERDQNLSIKYYKGVGAVIDQDKQKAQDKVLGVGR